MTWFKGLSPLVRLALVAMIVRSFALVRHHLGTDLLGQPIAVEPGRFLLWALTYHAGLLLAVALPFVMTTHLWPRAERPLVRSLGLLFALLMLYGQLDLEVLRGFGTHLTPAFIAHYLGPEMFGDIGNGLADDWRHLAISGLIVLTSWLLFWRICRGGPTLEPTRPSWRRVTIMTAATVALLVFPQVHRYSPARLRVVVPSEVLLLRAVFTDDATPEPSDPNAATQAFRAALSGSRPLEFVDEDFPLVHTAPSTRALSPRATPDIFVIVVESLRGRELRPERSLPDDHPNLTALMRRGVTFPYFVSNGFPSSAGFFALHCSGWPHPSRFILSEFATYRFDCLPPRLHARGYETIYFTAANPSVDNQKAWAQKMYDEWRTSRAHNDRCFVDDFIRWLDERDAAAVVPSVAGPNPLFAWLATVSTHHPFIVTDAPADPTASEPRARYRQALKYTDEQLGRLVATIEARASARERPAVIVIVGDHGFPLDELAVPELEAQGCDRRVWTTAILLGPESLVGPPRELDFPASQVDIMPTLLAMIGDERPTAALGRDLLDGDSTSREAIVVTEGGLRLDVADTSLFTTLDGTVTWRENRLAASGCQLSAAEPDPDTRALADTLIARVQFWSWLVENNRVWWER